MSRQIPDIFKSSGLRSTAQALFYLNALIWLGLAAAGYVRIQQSGALSGLAPLVIAVMMGGNAVAMLLAGLGLSRPHKVFIYFAILLLLVNILLTFTDQFGLLDIITLLIDLLLLALVVLLLVNKVKGENLV